MTKTINNSVCALHEEVGVAFQDRVALAGINLEIPANSITVLVGRSGSGKTTFLRTFNRLNELFKGCRTSGRVTLRIGDKAFNIYEPHIDVEYLRRKVGMVFQNPNILHTSISRNIALPLTVVLGLNRKSVQSRLESVLRKVQLWDEVKDRLESSALSLSGGQQQRLCLARTLSLEPEILLLDEPTASLDFRASKKIEELLITLRNTYTIIAVSHSMAQTFRIADRIVVLKDGRLSSIIDPSQSQESNHHEQMFEEIF